MLELTGSQRKFLRGLAHDLRPVVQVGKSGVGEALVTELNRALDAHELVKVKFVDFKEERRRLCPEMARLSKAELVGLLGNVAIFYRPCEDPSDRRIRLPR